MKNELINMDLNTLIGMIPSIINRNNISIKNEFDNLYDSSENYIKVPINTTGRISGNTGKFINLETGPITFIGDPSVLNNFYTTSILFDHNSLFNRNSLNQHSIESISGLSEELKNINDRIDALQNINSSNGSITPTMFNVISNDKNSNKDSSIIIDKKYIKVYNNNIDSYNYPVSYYTAAPSYSTKVYKYKGDYIDVLNNMKYNYIIINNSYVKINNEFSYSFNTSKIGTVVNVLFDDKHNYYGNDFKIKLSSNNNNYKTLCINYNDIDLVTLSLICVDINEFGIQWKILNYSGNVKII